jgi:hypothetical protein
MTWYHEHSHRIAIVRKHFERKGYRVHSGLQFGCELVLYADDPGRVHSDFCVHVLHATHAREGTDPNDGRLDWRTVQTLVRSMPDLHKTLILANVMPIEETSRNAESNSEVGGRDDDLSIVSYSPPMNTKAEKETEQLDQSIGVNTNPHESYFRVDEIAIASEHAPFRHKKAKKAIGGQIKKQKLS